MVKSLQKYSPEQKKAYDLETCYVAFGLLFGPTIVCSNNDSMLTFTFLWQVQIGSPMLLYEETVRQSFNGINLHQMTRVTKGLFLN